TDSERFVDEIVRTEVERFDLFGLAIARGEYDDRHIGPGAYVSDDILSVAIRETEIEQDYVRSVRGDAARTVGGRFGSRDVIVICGECRLQEPRDRRLVVDDQDAQPAQGARSLGKVRVKRLPRPSATGLSTVMSPP